MSQDTVLYEEFLEARRVAIDLTDAFQNVEAGDPRREAIWEGVVRQTEVARRLLDTWLRVSAAPQRAPETPIWVSAGRSRLRLRAMDRAAEPVTDAEPTTPVTSTAR
ncbi:MAG: hypothetical protein NVSMB2_11880 [Chloroflexota bacterium]